MAEGTLVITISNQVTAPAPVAGAFITGWHVPTRAEFAALSTFLGGDAVAGGKLKEAGLTHWDNPNLGADNSSGFTAFGGGFRTDTGVFDFQNIEGDFWASDAYDATQSYYSLLLYDTAIFYPDDYVQVNKYGNSLRLIKDDSVDPGTVMDYDGYLYETVKIGTQVWMAANLRTTHYADGTPIPIVTDNAAWAALTTAGMCYYNNTP
jgi:uncharacterized protein (TIGR02145 family)